MNTNVGKSGTFVAMLAIGAVRCVACVRAVASCVAGYGYDTDLGVRYSPGYKELFGYDVGGWGASYRVGPGQRGEPRSDGSSHRYRSAEHSHLTSSIPTGSHGRRGDLP
jgi:hypothetical protein